MVVVDWGYLAPLCATGVPRVTSLEQGCCTFVARTPNPVILVSRPEGYLRSSPIRLQRRRFR